MGAHKSFYDEDIKTKTTTTSRSRPLVFIIKIVLPLLIICIGIAGAYYLKNSGKKTRKRPPAKMTSLVRVMPLSLSSENVMIRAMGTVVPARELVIKSRVSGEITDIRPEFMQGGFLKADQEVLRIDPEDYKLAIIKKQSQVASAIYALKLEMGHQDVAKREWEIYNGKKSAGKSDTELALRKPHLNKAKADLAAARADLKQAELNLARTQIKAPFNAVVRTKYVEKGTQVSAQEKLAELVGTDLYWIQVSVPVDRLRWITIPQENGTPGSTVRILYGGGNYERTGAVIKLLSDLETEGRMARVLVSVRDPLDLENPEKNRPPLLIGEYVRVEIQGQEIGDVFRIPRTALRDDNSVWIAEDGRLSIHHADALWRDSETVLLRDGLKQGDKLIISEIAAPINGMPLRISEMK
ncbi:MAG: efflux RND transporter periplasmic adaptor subunit [Desulfobacteraceae bacterium]|nr:efflux RND transporter periplasmic adaptor subunit [Desulfobacteraceae bacterium]